MAKKNNKLVYFITSALDTLKPRFVKGLERKIALKQYNSLSQQLKNSVDSRVDYYNRLSAPTTLKNSEDWSVYSVGELKNHATFNSIRTGTAYYYDTARYLRAYNPKLRCSYRFGDFTGVASIPLFVKSRPITNNNQNSVVLKLNKIRHFNFISDSYSFRNKKDMLIGMCYAKQPHRRKFIEMYHQHPLCRVASVLPNETEVWKSAPISIEEHLKYKFILCLEGYDVATNLKWVMSSKSVAVMPKPKFETWFMEGSLIGGVHYIEINDDFSNLEEQLNYYIANPEKAEAIVKEAHRYIEQFKNKKIEKIISYKVIDKYFNAIGEKL